MLPDLQLDHGPEGDLVQVDPAGTVDVTLHWQQWELRSPSLAAASAVVAAARRHLSHG